MVAAAGLDELSLRRVELLHVGPTRRRTLCVLPLGKKKQQKVVVGDDTGVVQAFSAKKGEIVIAFKGLPSSPGVNSVTLGATAFQSDKIYVASGSTVRGFTKKGKEFFVFDTNLTEPIRFLQVYELDVWTAGDHAVNHYRDCVEVDMYLSSERINDLQLILAGANGERLAVIACQDSHVRVLQGSKVYYEMEVEGPVSCIQQFQGTPPTDIMDAPRSPGGKAPPASNWDLGIVYGTTTGVVGQLFLGKDSIKRGWTIRPTGGAVAGGVCCLCASFDLTKDGQKDVAVGRDNGSIEIYGWQLTGEPRLVFQRNVGESISTLDGGFVLAASAEDLLVQTFSGKVFAFSATMGGPAGGGTFGAAAVVVADAAAATAEKRLRGLQLEVERLRERLESCREKGPPAQEGQVLTAQKAEVRVNDRLALDPESGCYVLSLETALPMEMLALESRAPLDLVDVDSSTAIRGCSPADLEAGSHTLATYRFLEPRNRIDIRFRTVEGQYGRMQAFIVPKVEPRISMVVSHHIRPLSLHRRIAALPTDVRPMNELRITGPFSLADAHAWVGLWLPDVPSRPPTANEAVYHFISVALGTVLSCQYQPSSILLRSDNLSTISILQEAASRDATASGIRVSIAPDFKKESVPHFLNLLRPQLEHQVALRRRSKVLAVLREVKMHESDLSCFDRELLDTLDRGAEVEAEVARNPRGLELLQGALKDFYLDVVRFHGNGSRAALPQLISILEENDWGAIFSFFEKS